MNIEVADYSRTLVTICHSQGVISEKSMTFKDDITIVIKSQQYHDYEHLKSHAMKVPPCTGTEALYRPYGP